MVTNNKGKFNNADIIGLKIIIMKNIYFIIAIIFLFGCKKEKIEPSEKVDLTGKLKCLILKDNYKQLFKYYDTTGELKNISSIIGTDTFVFYSFKRESKSVFVYPDTNRFNYFYKILMDNQDLISSFKSWENGISKDLYKFSYTNKLVFFTDKEGEPDIGNTKYHSFTIENGNYTKYLHTYLSLFGGPFTDTVKLMYTNLPNNRYAPLQKLLLYSDEMFNYLGYDNNFIVPQNKNLVKSIEINGFLRTKDLWDFEYEFNALSQLTKMKITRIGGVQEYTMEYY